MMNGIIATGIEVFTASWKMLLDSSLYMLFGLMVGGLLKVFLSPAYVSSHLGSGRFKPVIKAALIGIPIPLCSCGVLPAAASLKKQGANNGATVAFLVSTPESGVDSISISWALLDPLMTIFRPVAAFLSAVVAGMAENTINPPADSTEQLSTDLRCPVDNCCEGIDCSAEEHRRHHSFPAKISAGIQYAFFELWKDLAVSFFIGILLAGFVTVLLPDTFFHTYLGGGLPSMLLMLVVGIPLYICATASTPVAAAFILKGVSPGAALVFLLVGPATNITSISVLTKLLGKRSTVLYLVSLSIVSVLCGLGLDLLYSSLGLSAQAVIGQAADGTPLFLKTAAALVIIALSIRPFFEIIRKVTGRKVHDCSCSSSACSCEKSGEIKSELGFPLEGDCECGAHKH